MRLLLLSTYELGHQPLHVAGPAAALIDAGHQVRCTDLAVERLDAADVDWADAVALSVPMHTATRLAVATATAVRAQRPALPICAYGLYAGVGRSAPGWGSLFDHTVAGEYEPALVAWADGVAAGTPPPPGSHRVELARTAPAAPARHLLPPLERYARLSAGGGERTAGYVEASHGCSHRCTHCPVPAVYGGRVRVVPVESVVADVDRLVASGARHVTFGDPDFLNAPRHALRVVDAVHRRHPELTFDVTTKVEHVLRHREIWGELTAAGLLFVVSAFECVNDAVLERLRKGHTAADAAAATSLLRRHGVEVRPSLLPFTPWTTVADVRDIVDFVIAHDLVPNVDPVHYSIRLLVPPDSLLLEDPEVRALVGPFDPQALAHPWSSPWPEVDDLQRRLAAIAERHAAGPGDGAFAEIHAAVSAAARAAGVAPPRPATGGPERPRPRLTEAWFCCAEPTGCQLEPIAAGSRER